MELALDQIYLNEQYTTSGAPVESEKQETPDIAEGKNILKFPTKHSTGTTAIDTPIGAPVNPVQELQGKSDNYSSEEGIKALRKAYLQQISNHVKSISQFIEDSAVNLYISRLFRTLLEFQESSPDDPFLIITSTLYNALATDNKWIHYSADQYAGIIDIINKANNTKLTEKKIFDAISCLENVGFDTNPFSIDLGDDE